MLRGLGSGFTSTPKNLFMQSSRSFMAGTVYRCRCVRLYLKDHAILETQVMNKGTTGRTTCICNKGTA